MLCCLYVKVIIPQSQKNVLSKWCPSNKTSHVKQAKR